MSRSNVGCRIFGNGVLPENEPMNADPWLDANAPGFATLPASDRRLLMNFSLIWSLFEGEVLNTSAGTNVITNVVAKWNDAALIDGHTFASEAAYFRDRYFVDGSFTYRFEHLHLDRSGDPEIVRDVLSGRNSTPAGLACAVLIIVFRYRNNLFHGEKWAYQLREQHENFQAAINILKKSIELNRLLPEGSR